MKRYLIPVVSALVVTLTVTVFAAGDKARELKLQQAIELIETKGDLAKATPLLEDVAKSDDRALAARGLLHLAQAQERHGHAGASVTYQRIISGFGTAGDAAPVRVIADTARTKLAALEQRVTGLANRQVWQQSGVDFYASQPAISPDGRTIAFVDWNTGDLGIYDRASGRERLLTSDSLRTRTYAEDPVFSNDSRFIAFGVETAPTDQLYELRVIDRNGGQSRMLRRATRPGDKLYVQDFHPDGKSVLITEGRDEERPLKNLVLVPIDGSAPRVIKVGLGSKTSLYKFSPDGQFITYSRRWEDGPSSDLVSISAATGKEFATYRHPATDFMVEWFPRGDRILFRSDRGRNMGLWSVAIKEGIAQGEPALVQPNISAFGSLGFTADGEFYYDVEESQAEVYLASSTESTAKDPVRLTRVEGRYQGLKSHPAWSPNGEGLVYVQLPGPAAAPATGPAASQTIALHEIKSNVVNLIEVPLRLANNPFWTRDGQTIVLQGRDRENRQGVFKVDVKSGALTPIAAKDPDSKELSRIRPVMSADGQRLFFKSGAGIFVREMSTGAETRVAETSPEAGNFALSPDGAWLVMTQPGAGSDLEVLVTRSTGGTPRRLTTFAEGQTQGFAVAWSIDGRAVFAARRAARGVEVWRVPIDGSTPTPTGIVWSGHIDRISVSPDGRTLALGTFRLSSETWVLQNLTDRRVK